MQRSKGASSSTGSRACAACKCQRKRCPPDCPLAPYFPADKMDDFNNARKLFGTNKIIQKIKSVEPHLRADCVKAMVFEANVRAAYPVGGCLQYLLELQKQICSTELELKKQKDHIALCKAQKLAAQQQYLRQNQMFQPVDGHVQGQVSAFNDQGLEGFNMYNAQAQATQQQYVRQNQMVQAVDGHVRGQVNAFNDQDLEGFNMYNAQAQATQQQYLGQNQMVQAVDGHVQGQVNSFNDQGLKSFNMYNAQAPATQQQYLGQNQMVQTNAFNDLSLEGFNMYNNTLPDHFQDYQEEAGNVFHGSYGGSSSSSTVYNVFDPNLVNVQSEAPVVGEDIMPLLDMFDDRGAGAFRIASNGSNSQFGDQFLSKLELGSRSTQQVELQHDLKDAASQFTLRNNGR